jgi:hypothetical protein
MSLALASQGTLIYTVCVKICFVLIRNPKKKVIGGKKTFGLVAAPPVRVQL